LKKHGLSVIISQLNVLFYIQDIGGVMISQISGLDSCCAIKDPRRKAQSMRFKNNADTSVQTKNAPVNKSPKENAIWTSFSIIVGAVVFVVGYFMVSSMRKA